MGNTVAIIEMKMYNRCIKFLEKHMPDYNKTKISCYFSYLAMSSVFSLPPLLFVTFHEMYGISYTLLGTLLLVNFATQLAIDLVFTFLSKHFNIRLTLIVMPLITSAGLAIYGLVPFFMPQYAYAGLLVGTVIFSVAAGLSEVLMSPTVAACPSEHPDKDMSMLHSLYGWGVVTVVAISSLYFKLFGTENWLYLTMFWAFLPIISSVTFYISPTPELTFESVEKGSRRKKNRFGLFLCVVCLFLGSCAENLMTGWISSIMEKALLVPKATGDILGMAVFALLLATTRSVYAKFGKNIMNVLVIGMAGAFVCYIVAGFSTSTVVAFLACILVGMFAAMLWPGTLIMMEENIPSAGVAAYALMAAAGDSGASFAPQLMGIITDKAAEHSEIIGKMFVGPLTPDQVGMKFGLVCAAVFPLLGLIWVIFVRKYFLKKKQIEK